MTNCGARSEIKERRDMQINFGSDSDSDIDFSGMRI
jgi:hypothetical protein